jgi:hypothetical protein
MLYLDLLLPRKGKFTTGRSKPYIFASPQELEKVIVSFCPGLPVPPPMFQCISVDLLYKSTVHNSFVSYCLLNMTWNSAFIAPIQKKYHKKIYNNFQTISEYYESS